MKVSIITVSFNSEKTLRDTLDSVAKQEYKEIEHVLIDGGSTDNTLKIATEFPHLSKVISEKDDGFYDAINKGLNQVKGDIIGILNSDDFYADNQVISDVVSSFFKEDIDLLYADLWYVDGITTNKVIRNWKSGKYSEGAFLRGWMPPHPTFFVKKRVYEKYGLFNLDLGSAADYEIMLRFIHKEQLRLSYLPRIIVKMRTGGMSNASLSNRLKANLMDRKAWTVNGLTPKWYTLYLKPLRKIPQYFS